MDNTKPGLRPTRQVEGRRLRAALRSNLLYNHYLPTPASRPLTPHTKRG